MARGDTVCEWHKLQEHFDAANRGGRRVSHIGLDHSEWSGRRHGCGGASTGTRGYGDMAEELEAISTGLSVLGIGQEEFDAAPTFVRRETKVQQSCTYMKTRVCIYAPTSL